MLFLCDSLADGGKQKQLRLNSNEIRGECLTHTETASKVTWDVTNTKTALTISFVIKYMSNSKDNILI